MPPWVLSNSPRGRLSRARACTAFCRQRGVRAWITWRRFFGLFGIACKSILRHVRLRPEEGCYRPVAVIGVRLDWVIEISAQGSVGLKLDYRSTFRAGENLGDYRALRRPLEQWVGPFGERVPIRHTARRNVPRIEYSSDSETAPN